MADDQMNAVNYGRLPALVEQDDQISGANYGRLPAPLNVEQDEQVNEITSDHEDQVSEDMSEGTSEHPDEFSETSSPIPDEAPTEQTTTATATQAQDVGQGLHITHQQIQQHRDLLLQYAQRFGLQTLLFLQVVWTLLSQLLSTTQTVSTSILRGIQSKTYVFFQGSTHPYRLQEYTLTGPGVPPVEWYYDADKKVFVSSLLYNTSTEYESHHLQWLSGQILYNNLVLYDISEYLQEVKWAGETRPSTRHVLAAWSLHSGIVLHSIDGILLQTINEDGTETSIPICFSRV